MGAMSDEIWATYKIRDSMKIWAASGCKSYGYELRESEIQCVRFKGLTLNHQASNIVNLSTIVELVHQGEHPERTVHYPHQMRKDRRTQRIYARDLTKCVRLTFDKRIILDVVGYSTLAFGDRRVPRQWGQDIISWRNRFEEGKRQHEDRRKEDKKRRKEEERTNEKEEGAVGQI